MDGNTEPVIAVIGHPIAGNPSQFALERALESMGLDWRVFSFDVPPTHLTTALDGLEALSVRGVLIDESLANTIGGWRSDQPDDQADYTDCLFRDEVDGPLLRFAAQQAWTKARINEHAALLQRDIERTYVAGEIPSQAVWRTSLLEGTIKKVPRDLEKLVDADVVVIQQGDGEPTPLDVNQWPTGDESILVVDFSLGHPDVPRIQSLGYQVVSYEARRVAILSECFRRWTSAEAPRDVMLDAIEEYLAV